MVKRQTVWLSTMMVLSLMLIGYYTMNNGGQPVSLGGNNLTGNAVSAVTQPPTNTTAVNGQSATAGAKQTSTKPSTTDWFVNYQTQVETNITKQESTLTDMAANTNASTQDISKAEQQLQKLENLQGGMSDARQEIMGQGYKNCVIVPSPNSNNVTVYVQAKQVTNTQAVAIMNIVGQQLNMPLNNIIVKWKA